jgi:hypothetical protein
MEESGHLWDTVACVVCGRPVSKARARLYDGTCDHWKCRGVYFSKRSRTKQEQAEQERRDRERLLCLAISYRDAMAAACGIPDPETFTPFVVPANQRRLAEVPAERRYELREHLLRLLQEAAATKDHTDKPDEAGTAGLAPDEDSTLAAAFQAACGTCQGQCCLGAGSHAHLNVETVQGYRERHGAPSAADMLHAYESKLGACGYEGSCIFHGAEGCALPRDMRSSSCTSFECVALRYVRDHFRSPGANRRIFLAAMEACEVIRGSFHSIPDDSAARAVRPGSPLPAGLDGSASC